MHRCTHGLNTVYKPRSCHLRALCLACPARNAKAYSSASAGAQDIAILGGGVSGLASAYYLTKQLPEARITIYEASDRLGGWLSSKRVPVRDGSVLFEAGPRTLRPSANGVLAASLMQELDLAKDAIFPHKTSPAAQNRYIYYPNHLVRMPHPAFGIIENFLSLVREPIFAGAIWASATEMLKDQRDDSLKDESAGHFFARRLDKRLVDRILSAVLHGIYAGDAYQLSAKSLFPGPWRDEGQYGSVFSGMTRSMSEGLEVTKQEAQYLQEMKTFDWDPLLKATLAETAVFTFKDGLAMLSDKLSRHLISTGTVEFKTSTPVQSISLSHDQQSILVHAGASEQPRTFSNVISALTSNHLNALCSKQTLVPDIPSVTVMTVNLYFRTPDLNPPGFGYLIPQATPFENNPERALGVIFDTAYSPSPKDVDPSNWSITDPDELQQARDRGQLVNVNDFAWYNMPNKPNIQDDVSERGTKLTVMLGGHWWNGWPSYPSEEEGLALAKSLLQRHLGIKEEPEAWQANLQPNCIPQYTVGHEKRLKTAHDNIRSEFKGRLRVVGNWMAGVGVNDCLRSAWEAVRSLRDGVSGTGLEQVGTTDFVRLKQIKFPSSSES